jgi:hypothetical protein
VWYFLSKDGTVKGVDQLRANLMRPLPGMADAVSDEVVSHELSMFAAALTQSKKG